MTVIKNMVLNNSEIIEALDRETIKIIEYSWDGKLISKKYNTSKLKGAHKICLHVGFLIRTLSDKRWIHPKVLYNGRDGIIDLRKVEERKYTLQPKESVIIYTNEVIKSGSEYFGMILAGDGIEETGLTVSPSYIDPNQEGILQLIVTNNSETPKLLQERCEIADLILFKMDKQVAEIMRNRNGHYGITWEVIFENPIFPKWEDRKRTWILRLCHTIRTYWILFIGIGVAGGCAVIYQAITLVLNILGYLNL